MVWCSVLLLVSCLWVLVWRAGSGGSGSGS